MSKSKFIYKAKELFGFISENEKKNKAIKKLLKKIEERRKKLKKELLDATDIKEIESLKDSIKIVKKQIKKGKELLK